MKTLRKEPVKIEYVESLPAQSKMQKNIIYVCENNNHATHLCLGCFERPVTVPMNEPNGWQFKIENDIISVVGSFLNHPCECHYIITNGVANLV